MLRVPFLRAWPGRRRPDSGHLGTRGRPSGDRDVLRTRGGPIAMSRPRWVLVALLVLSTALFAVGAIAERSSTPGHTEAASTKVGEASGSESAHEEGEQAGANETHEGAVGVHSSEAKTNE